MRSARPLCLVLADNSFSTGTLTVRARNDVMVREMSSQCTGIRSASHDIQENAVLFRDEETLETSPVEFAA